jgi:hypothetical protein
MPIIGPRLDFCHPLFEFLPKLTKAILFPKTTKPPKKIKNKKILKKD